jgi:hypothetical protein
MIGYVHKIRFGPYLTNVHKFGLIHVLVTMHIIHCNDTVDSNPVYLPPKASCFPKVPQHLLQPYKLPQQGTRLFP